MAVKQINIQMNTQNDSVSDDKRQRTMLRKTKGATNDREITGMRARTTKERYGRICMKNVVGIVR